MNQDPNISQESIENKHLNNQMSGIRKASILLIALGNDISTQVLKYLSEEEIKKVTYGFSTIEYVSSEERKEVLEELMQMLKAKQYISAGGLDYAKELLTKALGNQAAQKIIRGIGINQSKPFELARKASSEQILSSIYKESPQVIAIILTYIQPDKAAEVMMGLNDDTKIKVSHKISNMSNVPAFIIGEIESSLNQKLSNIISVNNEPIDGISTLVSILNNIDGKNTKQIIESIEKDNTLLADKIKDNIFVFKDIEKLKDIDIQRILREVDVHDLAFALKGMSIDFTELIYKNQSERSRESLKQEIRLLGPVKVSEVETARQKIIEVVRKLGEQGIIIMPIGEQDEFIE